MMPTPEDDLAAVVRRAKPALDSLLRELTWIRIREQKAVAKRLTETLETLVRDLGHDPMDPAVRAIIAATIEVL